MANVTVTDLTPMYKRYWGQDIDITAQNEAGYPEYDRTDYRVMFGGIRVVGTTFEVTHPIEVGNIMPIFTPPRHCRIYNSFLQVREPSTLSAGITLRQYGTQVSPTEWNASYSPVFRETIDSDEQWASLSTQKGDGYWNSNISQEF